MNSTAIQFQLQTDNPDIRFVQGMNVNHTFPCHIHHSFSLGLVQQGRRIIYVDQTPHLICANECFIINPYQPHSCGVAEEEGHSYEVISLSPRLLQDIYKEVANAAEVPRFYQVKITEPAIVNGFADWLKKQSRHNLTDSAELIAVLRELVLRYAQAEPVAPEHSRQAIVAQACAYIEANFDRLIRLNEIAAVTHVSPFYLNRIFRQEIGIPPHTYLLQARIKKSLEQLLQTGSILEAAYALGFSDQSHFSRFFKKNIGLTPKQYLNLHQNKAT